MIKWAVVAAVLAACAVAQIPQVTTNANMTLYFNDHYNANTASGIKCSRLEGTASDCLACYGCNHDKIKTTKKPIQYLYFSYSNCTKIQACCIHSTDLSGRSNGEGCGKINPEGDPRVQRPSLRAVLEREYPWRAWVYSHNKSEPLCAASYIYFRVRALLTTASCVSGYQPSDLRIRFTRTQEPPYCVDNVVIHNNFSNSTGGNKQDIAFLVLKEKPERRVQPVCIQSKPVPTATPCVVVSDSETSIKVVVPPLQKCDLYNVTTTNDVMCTFIRPGDYVPERGAGLYCLSEHFEPPAYILEGIFQSYNKSVAIYTSVSKFSSWISDIGGKFRKSHHSHY